jgi:pimeloyl-ACP methyl ester carboxylesterase
MTVLAERFGDRDVRVPDLDGHGLRTEDAPYSLDLFVATALAAAGDGEPADLVGYSLGGYVALATAIAHPHRVRRVVTVATKLDWATADVAAAAAGGMDPDAIEREAPAFAERLAAQHPGPGWRSVMQRTAAFIGALGTAPPLDLARVPCPVLLLVGAEDALVTREECERARDTLPYGTLEVLPDRGHPFERMDLDAVEALVRRALA